MISDKSKPYVPALQFFSGATRRKLGSLTYFKSLRVVSFSHRYKYITRNPCHGYGHHHADTDRKKRSPMYIRVRQFSSCYSYRYVGVFLLPYSQMPRSSPVVYPSTLHESVYESVFSLRNFFGRNHIEKHPAGDRHRGEGGAQAAASRSTDNTHRGKPQQNYSSRVIAAVLITPIVILA